MLLFLDTKLEAYFWLLVGEHGGIKMIVFDTMAG